MVLEMLCGLAVGTISGVYQEKRVQPCFDAIFGNCHRHYNDKVISVYLDKSKKAPPAAKAPAAADSAAQVGASKPRVSSTFGKRPSINESQDHSGKDDPPKIDQGEKDLQLKAINLESDMHFWMMIEMRKLYRLDPDHGELPEAMREAHQAEFIASLVTLPRGSTEAKSLVSDWLEGDLDAAKKDAFVMQAVAKLDEIRRSRTVSSEGDRLLAPRPSMLLFGKRPSINEEQDHTGKDDPPKIDQRENNLQLKVLNLESDMHFWMMEAMRKLYGVESECELPEALRDTQQAELLARVAALPGDSSDKVRELLATFLVGDLDAKKKDAFIAQAVAKVAEIRAAQ